jgi:aryl-alcohol dehydrogenase-like predicted oxidoreductase
MEAKHNIQLAEAAQRWIQHHSVLGPEDAVLLGVSNVKQVDTNIKDWYVFEFLIFADSAAYMNIYYMQ